MGQDILGPDPTTDRGPYDIDPGLLIRDHPHLYTPDEEKEDVVNEGKLIEHSTMFQEAKEYVVPGVPKKPLSPKSFVKCWNEKVEFCRLMGGAEDVSFLI